MPPPSSQNLARSLACISCHYLHSKMSSTAPYSSSIIALIPVMEGPSLDAKRLCLHSAIASSDNSTTPIVVSYWPGSEPRAAGINDLAMISASVRFTNSNGSVAAFADASFVNVIVAGDDADIVDPASDATAIFHLTGMVTLIAPGEREFELETGAWATEVCVSFITSTVNMPSNVNCLLLRRHQLLNGQRYADSPPQSGGRTLSRPLSAPPLLSELGMKATKVENPFSPLKTSPTCQNCFVQALARPRPALGPRRPLPAFSKAKSAWRILMVKVPRHHHQSAFVLTRMYSLLSPHLHRHELPPLPARILPLHLMNPLNLPLPPPRGAHLTVVRRLDFVSDVGMSLSVIYNGMVN